MEKNRDKTPLYGDDLEIQYANLLSKSKLMESDYKKEILELKILYQSEKEKSTSLEKSIRNYPSKVSALEQMLKQETALRKSLESALEENSNFQQKEAIEKELKRYKKACSQLQSENRALNQHYLTTLSDKTEIQKKLTKYVDFLNRKNEKMKEDHDKVIEELKLEENERRTQENKELRKEIEQLNTRVSQKKEKISAIFKKYEDSKDFQLEIATQVDQKDSLIRQLQTQNKELLKRTRFIDPENPDVEEDIYGHLEKLRNENLHLKNKIQLKKEKFYKRKENYVLEINQVTSKVKDLEKTKTKLESDINLLRSKIHDQSETIQNMQIKLRDFEEEHNEAVKKTRKSMEPLMIKLRTERDSFKAQLDEVYKSIDHSPLPSQEPSLFDEISDLNNQTPESLELELSKISDEKAELQREISNLNSELSVKTASISELESEIASLNSQLVSIQELVAALSTKDKAFSDLQERNTELEEDINSLKTQISQRDETLQGLEVEKTKNLETIQHLQSVEAELKQKEITISEIQNQNSELQKEVDLLQKVNSEIIQKELVITEISDVEEVGIPGLPLKNMKESFSVTADESDRITDLFISEVFDKESIISDFNNEKSELDLLSQSTLQALSINFNEKCDIAAVLELESERDMLKSEILRLETQLKLSNQEWTVYSNQLYQELVKEHDEKLKLIEHNNYRKTVKQPSSARLSWWKRKNR